MIHPHALVGLFLSVAVVLGAAPLLLAWGLGPKKLNTRKLQDGERETATLDETSIEFEPEYTLFALVYVVCVVTAALLLPWALAYRDLSIEGVAGAAVFLALLGAGLIYVASKGWLA